jgi:hypothetical protein
MSIFVWKRDVVARSNARAFAAIWAKYEIDCSPLKKGPLCDFPPITPLTRSIPKAAYPAVALGPPLLFFVLGWMWLWLARGSRR